MKLTKRFTNPLQTFFKHAPGAGGVDAHMTVAMIHKILAELHEHTRAGNPFLELLLRKFICREVDPRQIRSFGNAEHRFRQFCCKKFAHFAEVFVQIEFQLFQPVFGFVVSRDGGVNAQRGRMPAVGAARPFAANLLVRNHQVRVAGCCPQY